MQHKKWMERSRREQEKGKNLWKFSTPVKHSFRQTKLSCLQQVHIYGMTFCNTYKYKVMKQSPLGVVACLGNTQWTSEVTGFKFNINHVIFSTGGFHLSCWCRGCVGGGGNEPDPWIEISTPGNRIMFKCMWLVCFIAKVGLAKATATESTRSATPKLNLITEIAGLDNLHTETSFETLYFPQSAATDLHLEWELCGILKRRP